MTDTDDLVKNLLQEREILRQQLAEIREPLRRAEETLQAIYSGEVDALVIATNEGERVFTLEGADQVYKLLVEKMGEGAATVSSQGLILYCNRKLSDLLNCPLENLMGSELKTFICLENLPAFEQFWQKSQQETGLTTELSLRTLDNTKVPVRISLSQLKIDEMLIHSIIVTDLTSYKRKEEALAESEHRFRQAFMESSFPMIIHAENGEILQINKAWTEITGYDINEIPTIFDWTERAYGEWKEIVRFDIDQLYKLNHKIDQGEHIIKTLMGENRIWDFSTVPLGRLPDGRQIVISMAKDVTKRKQVEDQLRRSALYDSLTGLANRNLLMDRIEQSLKLLKRKPEYLFAVLFLDLDRFKLINDTFGHKMGDSVLIKVAEKLNMCVRPNDTVARLGGDEFVVLLQNLNNREESIQIATRILNNIVLPLLIETHEFFLTVSIGMTFSSTEVNKAMDLLRNADLAMYDAKKMGKACYRIYEPELHQKITQELLLETALTQALNRQEFLLHYQPIISLATQKIVGFEVLVRWQSPEKGLIIAGEFIPIAEEIGLIIPLGEWILCEACRQMKMWQSKFPQSDLLYISINLSGKQLQQSNFVEQIDKCLAATGFKSDRLSLEITESVLLQNRDSITYFMTQMRERQIRLSIDDFGTGYSSLSYLHTFPFDNLKIDRSFVSDLDPKLNNLKIVQTIVTLAHHLGLSVIAEGIETEQQLLILKDLGCEFGQGYFFSQPLSAQAAEVLLSMN